ncbi:hypothetical protein CN918_27230 [Priestia megaterium]|nr:hypothetical protein CN918_27230 [Priestia megaterium]
MVTPERYAVIKKFGNALFMFHQKQASPENKEKLRNLLKKMVLTNEFQWNTNQATKEVIVTFELGQMVITVGEKEFHVHIDPQTRHNLKKFGRDSHTQKKESNSSPDIISITSTLPREPESQPQKIHKEQKSVQTAVLSESKDMYALAQEEAFRRYEEKEQMKQPILIPKKEVVKEEQPKGEPLFLGFLSEGDYAM